MTILETHSENVMEQSIMTRITEEEAFYRLERFGLTPNEIKLLFMLWKYGQLTASEMQKLDQKIGRTAIYILLEHLAQLGLVSCQSVESPTKPHRVYSALPVNQALKQLISLYNISFQETLSKSKEIADLARSKTYEEVHIRSKVELRPHLPHICYRCQAEFTSRKKLMAHKKQAHRI